VFAKQGLKECPPAFSRCRQPALQAELIKEPKYADVWMGGEGLSIAAASGGLHMAMKRWIWLLFTAAHVLFWTELVLPAPESRFTVMCYMNGDNDLTREVLHAVDRMETVGSSEDMHIFALVDGGREATPVYGDPWTGTKLLKISRDETIGRLRSQVLCDLGEANLADPRTLEDFVRYCLRFPADKYLFFFFSHGRGIIDTHTLKRPGGKTQLCVSPEETNQAILARPQFRDAIRRAMGERRFELMVLFSCLTNMVEVGYGFRDTTRYLVGSEDEIRLVDHPPGTFQIRGIRFEELLKRLREEPNLSARGMGQVLVDTFIEQYMRDVRLPDHRGGSVSKRFAAALSLIDCSRYDAVAERLDRLARHLLQELTHLCEPDPLPGAFRRALSASQRYGSFLNLEYYDLQDFLQNLKERVPDPQTRKYCEDVLDEVCRKLIVYERHTSERRSKGVSIYLSHFLVPENVYQCHTEMYRRCRFSRKTGWDEMIDLVRCRLSSEEKTN
jgi:hypothetical protein